MKKQILLGLALASWWTSLLLGQSPPPPPTPTKSGQEKQDVSSVEKSPAQNTASPAQTPTATINKTPAEPNQENKNGKPAKRGQVASSKWNWSAINTGIVTFFTLILTGVGVLQYLSMRKQGGYMQRQADYMRRGLPVSINAAKSARFNAIAAQDAIKLAEHNTAVTERAVILLESILGEPQEGLAFPYFRDNSVIIFTLRNYGATVAYDVKINGKVEFTGSPPGLGLGINGAQGVTIAPQGSNQWITASLLTKIEHNQIAGINQGHGGSLTYQIDVTYTDAFNKTHSYKAAGQYIPLLRGFITGSSTSD